MYDLDNAVVCFAEEIAREADLGWLVISYEVFLITKSFPTFLWLFYLLGEYNTNFTFLG